MNVAEFERYLDLVAKLLPAPPHTFDVPVVPDKPTDADVRAATERLIELEGIAAELPDRMRWIDHINQSLSYVYNANEADEWQDQRFWDATMAMTEVRESYVQFQTLLAQQISHWQSAVAVMEHDIAWQQATGTTTRAKPKPSAALDRARYFAMA
jgi:hypothetical protein